MPAPAKPANPPTSRELFPTLLELFAVFSKIGLTSFGGGLSGWMLREFVQVRGWIGEEESLTGLALAQAFPGVNVFNLSIWIGYRLRGGRGALVSTLGMIVPAALLIVVIGAVFASLSGYPLTRLVLDGVGAAAIGLSLSMGVTAARRAARGVVPVAVMVAAFVAVGVLRWPLPLVVVVLSPLSVALAYVRLLRA